MATLQSVILADSPQVYYQCNEASGTTVYDSSGNNNHGTITGTASLGLAGPLPNVPNTAIQHDGTSSYIASSYTLPVTSTLTYEMFILLPATGGGYGRLMSNGQPDGASKKGFELGIRQDGGYIFGNIGNATTNISPSYSQGLAYNQWMHLVLTYDGANTKLYVNGTLRSTVAQTGTIPATGYPVWIGQNPLFEAYSNVRVAHAAVYTTTLSAARITAHYNAWQAHTATAPLNLYTSNVISGTVATANSLYDRGAGGTASYINMLIGTATNYGEVVWQNGNAGAWAASGALPAPTGKGLVFDNTSLEGLNIVIGNWTINLGMWVTVGNIVADINFRAYKRSSGGVYTAITSFFFPGAHINTVLSDYWFQLTSVGATSFGVGDKLYIDVFLKITTNNTGSGTAGLRVLEGTSLPTGSIDSYILTPGTQPIVNALTVYPTVTAATTIASANKLVNATGAALSPVSTFIDARTAWGEVRAQGTGPNYWQQLTAPGAPTGSGWLWDVTTLQNTQFNPGLWSASMQFQITNSVGQITADILVRAYKVNSGIYTPIGILDLTGQTITTTTTTYAIPAAWLGMIPFGSGDKLYMDCWLNITATTCGANAKINTYQGNSATQGNVVVELITAGYLTVLSNTMLIVDSVIASDAYTAMATNTLNDAVIANDTAYNIKIAPPSFRSWSLDFPNILHYETGKNWLIGGGLAALPPSPSGLVYTPNSATYQRAADQYHAGIANKKLIQMNGLDDLLHGDAVFVWSLPYTGTVGFPIWNIAPNLSMYGDNAGNVTINYAGAIYTIASGFPTALGGANTVIMVYRFKWISNNGATTTLYAGANYTINAPNTLPTIAQVAVIPGISTKMSLDFSIAGDSAWGQALSILAQNSSYTIYPYIFQANIPNPGYNMALIAGLPPGYATKQQIVKVYTPNMTFIDVWRDAPLMGQSGGPTPKFGLNTIHGQITWTLPRRFDAYGEFGDPTGTGTVGAGNIVQIWIVDNLNYTSGRLVWQGKIDEYKPKISDQGQEQVDVTITPLDSVLGDVQYLGVVNFGVIGTASTYVDPVYMFNYLFSPTIYANSATAVTAGTTTALTLSNVLGLAAGATLYLQGTGADAAKTNGPLTVISVVGNVVTFSAAIPTNSYGNTIIVGTVAPVTSATTVTAGVTTAIVVSSATTLAINMVVGIVGSAGDFAKTEKATILSIVGTTVTFTAPLTNSYTNTIGICPPISFNSITKRPYTYPFSLDPLNVASSGATYQLQLRNQPLSQFLESVRQVAPNNWFWRSNLGDNTVTFGIASTTPKHTWMIGKHIGHPEYQKSFTNLKNRITVRGTSVTGIATGIDINTYGQRDYVVVEPRILDQATADRYAASTLAQLDRTDYRSILRIYDNRGDLAGTGYDIETVQVGDTCRVLNPIYQEGLTLWGQAKWGQSSWGFFSTTQLNQTLVITALSYGFDYIDVEVSNMQPSQDRFLINLALEFQLYVQY